MDGSSWHSRRLCEWDVIQALPRCGGAGAPGGPGGGAAPLRGCTIHTASMMAMLSFGSPGRTLTLKKSRPLCSLHQEGAPAPADPERRRLP